MRSNRLKSVFSPRATRGNIIKDSSAPTKRSRYFFGCFSMMRLSATEQPSPFAWTINGLMSNSEISGWLQTIVESRKSVSTIDAMSDGERAAYYTPAKNIAHEWIASQLASPIEAGFLRGELLVQNHSARPETLLENIDKMTLVGFLKGFAAFGKDLAVIGVGVAR